jgi:hypothetical protein
MEAPRGNALAVQWTIRTFLRTDVNVRLLAAMRFALGVRLLRIVLGQTPDGIN